MTNFDCEYILKLLQPYLDENINDKQRFEVEKHLSACPSCFEKYLKLKNISQKIKKFLNNVKKEDFFSENISAYIDNELSKEEYFSFCGYTAINPEKRKELDEMLFFEEKLRENIDKNKKGLNGDLSKKIVRQIRRENPAYVFKKYVEAGVIAILLVLLTIAAGYFSVPDNLHDFAVKAHIIKDIGH